MALEKLGQGRDAVVLLSGGLDSMAVAGLAVEAGYALNALTIDYNQRHRREIDAAARNLVFLSLTLAWAEAIGARDIFIGVNALDYSGYPDCRPEFIAGFADLARLATKTGSQGEDFSIHAPLQYLGKAEIAREVQRLGLDPALSWSCYDPQPDGSACGLCDSCRLRRAGFAKAGVEDKTRYRAG
jgi:7-cyano-7-deazaguanine synthase